MKNLENAISKFLQIRLVAVKPYECNFLTCSGEVLMNTVGPFRQLRKMGTSFLRNAG